MTTDKLRNGTRLSVDEFMEMPDTRDKRKMELDEGELYIMPRPRRGHNFLQLRITTNIEIYLDTFDDPPAHLVSDVIVSLSAEDGTLLAPDVAIVLRGNAGILADRMVEGAPDIVIEILSSDRSRDLVRKRRLYAEAGVGEYWIVDPTRDTVTVLELRGADYVERAVLTADNTLTTPLLPGLAIPLADMFHHRRRPATGP